MEQHTETVRQVQSQVRYFYRHKQKVRIYRGASNSTRTPNFQAKRVIDVSRLNHIIKINVAGRYVLVEPSVPMDQLVRATLAHKLVPPVVMEFPGITVGGGIQGGAAESSSFKWGGFHETALEYEMVLGDGRKLTVSRAKHPDLFWGTACTYGSLGIITLVKLKLIPAAGFVRLVYHRTGSYETALAEIDEQVSGPADFVDGILFSQTCGVIMSGFFAAEATGPVARFRGRNDEWFYQHAMRIAARREHHEEFVPILDYLFRYDRGAFWMGRHAFSLFHLPFNRVTRTLLDSQMHTRRLYEWLHATDMSQRFIIQDICMPRQRVQTFIQYADDTLGIYPLWLLPLKPSGERLDKFGLSFTDDPLVINVGVWGKARIRDFADFVAVNRAIERKVFRLGGRKTLYAHAYYPRDEFWQLYDKKHYDRLRDTYSATAIFENLYDKVAVKGAYKAPLNKAFWHMLQADVRKWLAPPDRGAAV